MKRTHVTHTRSVLPPVAASLTHPRPFNPRLHPQDDPPPLWSTHQATVDKVEPYGVFVRLDGFRRRGLVPSSQLSDHLHFSRDDSDQDKARPWIFSLMWMLSEVRKPLPCISAPAA